MNNSIGNESLTVEFGGIDVTNDVISAPIAGVVKPDWGELPVSPDLSLKLQNIGGRYSPHNLVSMFSGNKLNNITIKVFRGGIVRWDGLLDSISMDVKNKVATITGETRLQNELNKSSKVFFGQNTPSELAKQILLQHNIPIDPESFTIAEDILNDIPVQAEISPDVIEWQGTLGDILQLLSVAGIGRFFYTNVGTIGFDTFNLLDIRPPIFALTDDHMEQQPTAQTEIRDPLRGYSVTYKFGVSKEVITGIPFNNPLQSIDLGATSAVTLTGEGSAVYLGERWVEVSDTPYYRITLYVSHTITAGLSLNNHILIDSKTLNFKKHAEIIGIDTSDPRFAKLIIRAKI